MVNLETAGSHL